MRESFGGGGDVVAAWPEFTDVNGREAERYHEGEGRDERDEEIVLELSNGSP